MLLARLLKYMVRDGSLIFVDHKGDSEKIGNDTPPVCKLRVIDPKINFKLLNNPGLSVPESLMDGGLRVEEGDLYGFFDLIARNYNNLDDHPLIRAIRFFDTAKFGQRNPSHAARKNVAHHYDLSGALYSLFLDSDRQYSCAYYTEDETTLEQAQRAKKRHIAAKLLLQDGQKVLDIGCGWGGLGLYLAKLANIDLTGVTLSTEQQATAAERAVSENLADRVDFRLQDYRDIEERFDRIVSVGMFEHVGKRNYREFFYNVRERLKDDGVMLLHTIGRSTPPSPINPFIRKYIFPGADLPSLSEIMPIIEESGLIVTDIEILRLHYASTLKHWREAFLANREKAAEIYDERFCRMWELYLVICEMGFRHQGLVVFQIQLSRDQKAVPLTRDYMVDWERAQKRREASSS